MIRPTRDPGTRTDVELQEFWLENLRSCQTLNQLRQSAFYAGCGVHLERCLTTPQVYSSARPVPGLRSFLRVAQWKIEKGKRFQQILERLQTDPVSDHLPIYADIDLSYLDTSNQSRTSRMERVQT